MSYNDAIPAELIRRIASDNGKYIQRNLPLDLMPEYTLPVEYFSAISTGYKSLHSDSLSECATIEIVDHPGFAKLRKELSDAGYIKMVTNYINGDVVLKPFKLNGCTFIADEQFCCASAMKFKLSNPED